MADRPNTSEGLSKKFKKIEQQLQKGKTLPEALIEANLSQTEYYSQRFVHKNGSMPENGKIIALMPIVHELLLLDIIEDRLNDLEIQRFSQHDHINQLFSTEWYAVSDRLTDEELVKLVKIMVLIEKQLGWYGGNIAAAIWLNRKLHERGLSKSSDITNWLNQHSVNPHLIKKSR